MMALLCFLFIADGIDGIILDPADTSRALFVAERLLIGPSGETLADHSGLPLTARQRATFREALRTGQTFSGQCTAPSAARENPLGFEPLRDVPVVISGTVLQVLPGWSPVLGAPVSRVDVQVSEVLRAPPTGSALSIGVHVFTIIEWGSIDLRRMIYSSSETAAYGILSSVSSCDLFAPVITASGMRVIIAGYQDRPGSPFIRRVVVVPVMRNKVRFDMVPYWRKRDALPLESMR